MKKKLLSIVCVSLLAFGVVGAVHAATLLGPTSYLSSDDSPFTGGSFNYFYLEDFEDHLFNVPGVSASKGGVTIVVFGHSLHDSVDADDGVIDDSGLAGDSYFSSPGSDGIIFTFNAGVLGFLPTHVGIVWTDGSGTTLFEAFDSNAVSLGSIGPVSIATGGNSGQTDEDRFFGVINPEGISSIFISNSSGGIEIDHLQYGHNAVPIPGAIWLLGSGLVGIAGIRRKKK